MKPGQLTFDQVVEGASLPTLVKRPSQVQLFRYSAVTWNAHRIHYDAEYARYEGYPDVLVQAHLHGAFLVEMLMAWMGPQGRLLRFAWQNRAAAVPGDELTCGGRVARAYCDAERGYVECSLEEKNQRGEVCAPGSALVSLPLKAAPG